MPVCCWWFPTIKLFLSQTVCYTILMYIFLLKAQYNATMQMPSPTAADNYNLSQYYQSVAAYPGFFDGTAWSTSNADSMSYLSNYNQQLGADYMHFSGVEYNTGFWPPNYASTAAEYASWTQPVQPQDLMKVMDGQAYMPTMDQAYTEAYSPAGTHQSPVTNGQEVSVSETDEVNELEQGIQKVSMNGHGDESQDSPSETSLHDSSLGNVNNSSAMSTPTSTSQPQNVSWANIAKKPAKPAPVAPKILTRAPPSKPIHENSWDKGAARNGTGFHQSQRTNTWSAPRSGRNNAATSDRGANQRSEGIESAEPDPTLSKLKQSNAYNPKSFDLNPKNARFFVIKSYSEDDIHRAIKYRVWCSTEHGNKRLDEAFKDREGKGPIYLFYSVNGSGHFCGMAQMMSGVDYQTHAGVWTQDKWKGSMEIKWIYVKDVPNSVLRHIRLENNENKPVTNSRDTQEVLPDKGKQVLKLIHNYKHTTSIFDDFGHYEKKEVEEGGEAGEKKKSSPKIMVCESNCYLLQHVSLFFFVVHAKRLA